LATVKPTEAPNFPVERLFTKTITIGVMMAPPTIALANKGTTVPCR
jgi:hypothetical protein